MIFYYRIQDLKSGKAYEQRTDFDEWDSYRDFIGGLEALNEVWSGVLRWEESTEKNFREKMINQGMALDIAS